MPMTGSEAGAFASLLVSGFSGGGGMSTEGIVRDEVIHLCNVCLKQKI